ncbi:hypothetical protein ACJX0J_026522, partial [Zea mays]
MHKLNKILYITRTFKIYLLLGHNWKNKFTSKQIENWKNKLTSKHLEDYLQNSGLIKYKRSTLILEKCQTLDELQTLKMHPYISVTTQATCHFQYTNNASKYQPKLAQCQHTPLEQKSIPAYRILGTRTR